MSTPIRLAITAVLLTLPSLTHAMTITEMAWMGSNDSSSCEWIELYNDDDTSIDLTGWTLEISSVPRSIESSTESLVVPAHNYFVIARSGATCAAYHATIADHIMSMTLTDTGFSYALKDLSGSVVSSFTKESIGWTAFKDQNSSRDTLQWTGAAWILAASTPGEPTVIPYTAETLSTNAPATSAWRPRDSAAYRDSIRALHIDAPAVAYRDVPFTLTTVSAPRDARKYKRHHWNFGDLETSTLTSPTHTYRENGTYLIHLSVDDGDDTLVLTQEITVIDVPLTLSRTPAGSITITNTDTHPLNLEGFTLGAFTIPKDSMLLPGKSVTISREKLGATEAPAILYSPEHTMVAALEESAPQTLVQGAPAPSITARTTSYASHTYAPVSDTAPHITPENLPAAARVTLTAATATQATSSQETAATNTAPGRGAQSPEKSSTLPRIATLVAVIGLAVGASFIRTRAQ